VDCVKHCTVKAFIVQCNLPIELKNTYFMIQVYTNFFLYFDVKNSLLKYVQAFLDISCILPNISMIKKKA
jgi:hypothetical protein